MALRGSLARPSAVVLASLAALGALPVVPLREPFEGLADYLPLHSLLEMVSIVVAALVFGVVWNAYARERAGSLVALACAFAAVALLDFVHLLSYPGMPELVTPASAQKSIFFWLAARWVSAAGFLAVAAYPARPLASPRSRYALLGAAAAAAFALAWLGLYREAWLPRLFVEGRGLTPAKVMLEYALIALFTAAAALLYRQARRSGSAQAALLAGAAAISALSELSLTLYATVTDVYTIVGHVYKVIAYGLVYRAVFVASVREPFERVAQREASLRESEDRYRSLVATMAEGVVMLDPGGRCLACNDSAARILGLPAERILGRTGAELGFHVIRDDGTPYGPGETPPMMALATGQSQADRTVGMRRADGTVTWSRGSSRPLFRPGEPRPYAAVSTFHDITERREIEQALREERNRIGLLADNVPAMIAYVDAQRRYRYANRRYRLFYAGSAAPIEGRKLDEVLTAQAWQAARPSVEQALAGEPVSYSGPRLLHDGARRQVAVSLVPHRDEASGEVRGIYILALDTTAQHDAEAALREREAGLRHAQEMAGLAHVVVRPDGTYERGSTNWPRLLGIHGAAPLPRSVRESLELVHPDDRERFRASAIEAARAPRRTVLEYRMRRPDGEVVQMRQTMEPIGEAGQGGAPHWFVTLQDVSEQKRAEQRIRRLNRVYAVLSGINGALMRLRERREFFEEACRVAVEAGQFHMAWIGIVDRQAGLVRPAAWSGDDVRGFLDVAPLAILETGPGGQGLAGRAVRELRPVISNDVANDPQRLMKKECAERGVNSLAVLPLVLGGEAIGVLALYAGEAGFFDEEEMRLLVELAGDVSFALDYIGKEERVRYLAYYDPLTGLANRTLFLERLAQHLAAAARERNKLALLMLNIERFKTINDTLGRSAGDALLKEFAARLERAARRAELVARVGADHFAVVLLDFRDDEQLIARLERGDAEVKETPFALDGRELRISTRSGVAVYPQDAGDAESLFRNAEAALKRAATGQKYLFYTEEMSGRIAGKLALENELRQALERSEFVLHYQPKIDLATRRITGVEALIRWASPARGLVPPGEFIPLLEETGLILQVGAWALAQAVRDHLAWQRAGLAAPRVAVNVSAIQLRERDFVARIRDALAPAGAAGGIDLEITESLLMEDVAANIAKLQALRALGVAIAIDDFGTGYSSLGYLARLPVQALKIDRSFVAAMARDSDTMSLVSTIVSLARSLRLKVIAEGVETELQENFLRAMRCDEAQGYLYGRPIPAPALEALLSRSPP